MSGFSHAASFSGCTPLRVGRVLSRSQTLTGRDAAPGASSFTRCRTWGGSHFGAICMHCGRPGPGRGLSLSSPGSRTAAHAHTQRRAPGSLSGLLLRPRFHSHQPSVGKRADGVSHHACRTGDHIPPGTCRRLADSHTQCRATPSPGPPCLLLGSWLPGEVSTLGGCHMWAARPRVTTLPGDVPRTCLPGRGECRVPGHGLGSSSHRHGVGDRGSACLAWRFPEASGQARRRRCELRPGRGGCGLVSFSHLNSGKSLDSFETQFSPVKGGHWPFLWECCSL